MRTTIVIENGKVTVQVEDLEPVTVGPKEHAQIITAHPVEKPAVAKAPPLSKERTSKECRGCGDQFTPVFAHTQYCDPCRSKRPGKAATKATANCAQCGTEFERSGRGSGRQKFCSTNCRDLAKSKKPGSAPSKPVTWCKHCSAFSTHATADHVDVSTGPKNAPAFLPGHEKSEAELESWRNLPNGEAFDDPWNCGMCRARWRLCRLHQALTDEGKKPQLSYS